MKTTTDIVEIIEQVADLLREDEAVTVIHPRTAAATGAGPEGLVLSAQVSTTCDVCGEPAPFVPVEIEGYFNRAGRLVTEAEWSRQHHCGGWPTVAVVVMRLTDDPRAAVAQLRNQVDELRRERDADLRENLREDLIEVLDRLAAGEDPDELETGNELRPGVFRAAGKWVAWNHGCTSIVEVSEDDL